MTPLTFARDSLNNKLLVKTGILNRMYTTVVCMCMRRLFCLPFANFMGQSDCLLCVWCTKKFSTGHKQYALALSYKKCQRTYLSTLSNFGLASASFDVAILQLKGQIQLYMRWSRLILEKWRLYWEKKPSKFGFSISVFVVPSFPCLVYPDTTHDPS